MTWPEAQTRSELIDKYLAQAGWNVKDPTQVIQEIDILTPLPEGIAEPRTPYEGHQFSDYDSRRPNERVTHPHGPAEKAGLFHSGF